MIKIEHLVKNYGSNCAVDDISIEIQKGSKIIPQKIKQHSQNVYNYMI